MKPSVPLFRNQQGIQLAAVDWLVDHHRAKERARRDMVDSLGVQPGDRVLDSACGPGLWSRLFAAKVVPGGGVVGLDFSPDLIDYARASQAHDRYGHAVEYVLGDFNDPPFAPASFDVVFLGNCLCYLPPVDITDVIRRHQRLVRPGGRVVSKEFDGASVIFHPLASELTLKVVYSAAQALGEAPSGPIFDNFVGRKTYGVFRKAGFRQVTTRSYAIQMVSPLTAEAKRYITGNAAWYGQQAARYLSRDELQQWQEAFAPGSKRYILDQEDFYFCMLETVTIGAV